jgi:hypothetical protein
MKLMEKFLKRQSEKLITEKIFREEKHKPQSKENWKLSFRGKN